MLKTLIAVLLVLSFVALVHGQDRQAVKSRMVREPFAGGDVLHAIQEVALDFKAQASGAGDRVAVRVCSKEKLPLALLTAAGSPFVLREQLKAQGFESERILFLRSEDCLANDPSIVVTEFWVVPKGAEPPESAESIRADQVQVEFVKASQQIQSATDYRNALQELLAKVSTRPEAVAVVVGSYYKRPGPILVKNLQTAKRVLLFGQGQASRVYIRSAPAPGIYEGDEREPRFPDLFALTIEPDAAQVPASCESAAAKLDFAVIETTKAPSTYLIIVARLGKAEPSNLNRGRLAAAEEYVLRRGTDFKYVVAAGERTSDLGRLELYVNGRLYAILPYEKNAKGHCIPGREGW
jgi:hypothetical protein